MTSLEMTKLVVKEAQENIAGLKAKSKELSGQIAENDREIARLEKIIQTCKQIGEQAPEPKAAKPAKPASKPTAVKVKPVALSADGTVNKSEFIRQHPGVKASELQALAAKQGFALAKEFVYTVRAQQAKKNAKATLVASRAAENGLTKVDFIRQHMDLTPKETVDAAKTAGISLALGYVYAARSKAHAVTTTAHATTDKVEPESLSDAEVNTDQEDPTAEDSVDAAAVGLDFGAGTETVTDEEPFQASPQATDDMSIIQLTKLVMGEADLSTSEILRRLQPYPAARKSANLKSYLAVILSSRKEDFERVDRSIYRVVQKAEPTITKPSGEATNGASQQVDVSAELASVGLGSQVTTPVVNPFS